MSNTANNVSSLRVQPDFGSSWSCVEDLTMPAVLVKGNRVVGESIARRLTTPRGQLVDDPNYGYALSEFVNADLTPTDLVRIQAAVQAECVKDERVFSAVATVTLTSLAAGSVLLASIVITTATGPFLLVLSVDDVSAALLQVTP